VSDVLVDLPAYLTGHLQLTLVALAIGSLVSIPLGVLASRVAWLGRIVLGVAGVIQTIPGLALLAVMVPLLASLNLTSIGYLPALLGLTLYSILPILRNTVTGLDGVDSAYLEAARGVGMTPGQQLRRVELPLAMPVIVAGVRTATVWVVGMATLSTPVGAPSLGNFIFSGLQTRNYTAVLVGCVAAAVLALILDGLVRLLEAGARERRRTPVVAGFGLLAVLSAYATSPLIAGLGDDQQRPIAIGAKTFTEQYILSALLARHITAETGLATVEVPSLGSTVAFDALSAGDIDVYVDYSGTIWATIMKRTDAPERAEVVSGVRTYLADEHGITLAAVLGFENAYALAMRAADGRALGVARIEQLAPHAPRMSIGGDYEFFHRPEWVALEESYGLTFKTERSMDSSLMYQAIAQGDVDVISAFSTDGRIEAFDLVVLEDDRGAIPPYDAIVLTSARVARDHPEVVRALALLDGAIDAARMRRMNFTVDEQSASPRAVARDFLAGR